MLCTRKRCRYEDMSATIKPPSHTCIDCEYGKVLRFFCSRIHLAPFGGDPEQRGKNDCYVYQYRTLDGFWRILESDSLWATHVRFSNDHAEQRIGTEYFESLLQQARAQQAWTLEDGVPSGENSSDLLPGDCYILCFCKNGDKLSQWRAYSAQGGVAIGFDLSNIRPFSILHREKTDKGDDAYHVVLNDCREVKYVTDPKTDTPFRKLIGEYDSSLIRKLSKTLIPFIKHSGFSEEEEFRLLFDNDNGAFAKAIHYRMVNEWKIPFIKVYAGDAGLRQSDVVVRVALGPKDTYDGLDELKDRIQNGILGLGGQFVDCFNDSIRNRRHCLGCTIRYRETHGGKYLAGHSVPCSWYANQSRSRHWVDGRTCGIYISQGERQREIYEAVKEAVVPFRKKTEAGIVPKIWCDGHLPIRKLVVGPSRNQADLMESIRHYCDNTWWLNDVEVVCSSIPYRS